MIRKLMSCLAVCGCGVGIGLEGCGNVPIIVHRPVVFQNDVTFTDPVNIDGVKIDENGNVIIPGNLTVTGNGNFTGTVTAGGTVTGQAVVDLPDPPPPIPSPPPAPVCGDGKLERPEQCDRNDFGNQTCFGYDGFDGGYLVCDANCKIKVDQCTRPPPTPSEPMVLTAIILNLTRTIQSDHLPTGLSVTDEVRYDLRVMVNNGTDEVLTLHYLLYDNTVNDSSFSAPVGNGEVVVAFVRNLTVATPFANDCFQVRKNGVTISLTPVCFPIIVVGSP